MVFTDATMPPHWLSRAKEIIARRTRAVSVGALQRPSVDASDRRLFSGPGRPVTRSIVDQQIRVHPASLVGVVIMPQDDGLQPTAHGHPGAPASPPSMASQILEEPVRPSGVLFSYNERGGYLSRRKI